MKLTEMQIKGGSIALAFLLVLAAPFLLRRDNASSAADVPAADTLIIITPHNETIRHEFSIAFEKHMRKKGRRIRIDWRTPGGTGQISKVMELEFRYAFENYWKKNRKEEWTEQLAKSFANRKLAMPQPGTAPNREQLARRTFLESDVGIGIDLFFGGGVYDFNKAARQGFLVSAEGTGLKAVRERHPDWFSEEVIPERVAGENFYDPELRWCGTCLSAFGFCFNTDTLKRVGIKELPTQWDDLGEPEYFGLIAIADPTKSSSVTKAFEMLIQQKIRAAMDAIPEDTKAEERPEAEKAALHRGWMEGLQLIQRIGANSRYFTDNSAKIPDDVASGNAAAGMCIDFYGRTYNERLRKRDGTSRVHYVTPVGGSSMSVDPIGMLRGAPNPDLATEFMRWLLSEDGQKIWNYEAGAPGGPVRHSLRRLPIRKDMYSEDHRTHMADASERPYETANLFVYEPAWTASLFNPLRFVLRVMILEPHPELKEAWQKIIDNGMPPRALEAFHDVSLINYPKVKREISHTLNTKGGISINLMADRFSNMLRRGYETAGERAQRKR